MNLGQRLTKLRTEKKLTIEEVAEILKVKPETVKKWENNENKLDFDSILPLCELFNITSDELLTGKKENVKRKKSNLYKQIESIISLIILIIYLGVSFLTMAWHITWIIWIIYAVIMEIVKLILSLKGVDYE